MAADARTGRGDGVADLPGVTARARSRRVVVLRVAGRAPRVCRGGEDGAILMTRGAQPDLRGTKSVRRVAAGARRMPRGAGGIRDVQRSALRRVAAHATSVGGEPGLVDAMAIDAAPATRVLGLPIGVTLRAWLRIEGWGAVRAVAARARLIGMGTDRMDAALGPGVTLQALRGRAMILAERVAVLTARRRGSRMERRHHGMAPCAQIGRRPRKAAIAVALRAGDLADVRRVTCAIVHVPICRRHLLGNAIAVGRATGGGDQQDEERPDHGALPAGWHSRHGIAPSGSLLDQPAGCGVPPTPPTLWHPTHSA
jgi:hypothetical protein